jgi:hypothetical protein
MPFKYNIPGQGIKIPKKVIKPLGSSTKILGPVPGTDLPGTGDAFKGNPRTDHTAPADPSGTVVFSPAAPPPDETLPALPDPDKDIPDVPIDLPVEAEDMSWVIPVVGVGLVALVIGIVAKAAK